MKIIRIMMKRPPIRITYRRALDSVFSASTFTFSVSSTSITAPVSPMLIVMEEIPVLPTVTYPSLTTSGYKRPSGSPTTIATGCRVGEAGALKWSDIDFKNNVVKINKTITRVSHTEFVVKNKPKTKKSIREIPLTKTAKDALKSQRTKTHAFDTSRNVFMTCEGAMVTKNHVNSAISNVLEKMEKLEDTHSDHFTSHALRATFATRAIEQGMTPQTLKTILGHSSIKITMDLYAHVLPNTKQEEMQKLEIVV